MESQFNYALGFNAGYILAKYKKSLVQNLSNSIKKESDYLIGLSDGMAEYSIEREGTKEEELIRIRETRGGRDRER